MLAWGGRKKTAETAGFPQVRKGGKKVGSRMRGGLRQPEENSGARPGGGRLGMEAGERQERFTFPIDSPTEAWQD